jgi:glycolate oxidase iron-sulfur subunit
LTSDAPRTPEPSTGQSPLTDPRSFSELLDDCVHCGFCLPTCPTYVLWGEEMDSPRGRIHLMSQGEAEGGLSPSAAGHIDNCLGCLACVSSCPSGVRYDLLLEETRASVEEQHTRPAPQRALRSAIFALFPYRRRLNLLRGPLRAYQASGLDRLLRRSGLLQRLSPTLATMERISPRLGSAPRLPERVPAVGRRRAVVGMLTGCVQGSFFPQVNTATARVLALEGCDVVIPRRQGCCGALSAHSGRAEEAASFARATLETFERAGVDTIVVNSAGCGSTMKHYDTVLRTAGEASTEELRRAAALSAKVRDITEFLTELGPVAERHPLPVHLAYHDACHLSHGQKVTAAPRTLLRAIPEMKVSDLPNPEVCCGSAGVYNLLKPEAGAELGERKAQDVATTGAELLVAGNPGCSMQIASALEKEGTRLPVAHTVQVLDASLRGLGPRALGLDI